MQNTMYKVQSTMYKVWHFFMLGTMYLLLNTFFSSCHTQKRIIATPAPVKLKGVDVIQLFDSVIAHQFNFTTLVGKADIEIDESGKEPVSFDINFRLKKDSAIWISIAPLLGIEVARVIVTKDSIRIVDRINKVYTARDYKYLEDLLKTHLNFEIMQAVIIGNYFPYSKNEKLKSVYEDSTFLILSTLNKHQVKRIMEDKDPTKPVIQDFWIDSNYKINKSKISDEKLNRTLEASYTNFFQVSDKLLPQNIDVSIVASAPLKIKVRYNKVTAEETTFPFSVPDKYERK